MVSLPELENRKRYWLEIWHGGSAWETGGPRGLLPTRECPQIASQQKMLKFVIFGDLLMKPLIYTMLS
jgi:hypothetical protein